MELSDFLPSSRHMREVLIFFFCLENMVAEAHMKLQDASVNASLCERTSVNCFRHFKQGYFNVDNRSHEERAEIFEDAELETFLDDDPCKSQNELASAWEPSYQALVKQLHALGMIQKTGTCVSYELKL